MFGKSVAGIALGAALVMAAPAAATTTINLGGGSSSLSGAAGNVRTFSGSGGLQVQASAWTYNGSTLSKSYLGHYSNGLGVTNANEGSGGSGSHAVDNYTRRDFILLVFNQAVNVASGVLHPYAQTTTTRDNDASVGVTSVAGLFAAGSASITTAHPLFASLAASDWNISGNNASPFLTDFNSVGRSGNVWLIGASDGYLDDQRADGFKLNSINVAAVPEPGTWAMMLLGFGMVGHAARRRRRQLLPQIA